MNTMLATLQEVFSLCCKHILAGPGAPYGDDRVQVTACHFFLFCHMIISATSNEHRTIAVMSPWLTTFGRHFAWLESCKQSTNNAVHKAETVKAHCHLHKKQPFDTYQLD